MKTKKTKILYVITKANWGGAQKYVFDLATGLDKNKFDISVAYGAPMGDLSQKLEVAGIRTIQISSLNRDINIWNEWRVFKSLRKIYQQEQPDILHLNSSKIGGLGALAGRLSGIRKIIFTAHGWAFNEPRGRLSQFLIKFFSWLTILLCHQIIVLSDAERAQVQNWLFINGKKLTRIYNGIQPLDFLERAEAQKFLEKKALENLGKSARAKLTDVRRPSIDGRRTSVSSSVNFANDFILGTIAELHRNKGLPDAIEAVNQLRQNSQKLKLIIIGEGEERAPLEKLIQEKNLENSVFLVGKIDNASRYLKAFDIFILPSLKEGFPFVLLEAGSAGLPTIATRVGGIPEIIADQQSGILIEPQNAPALANALKFLIENPETRQKLGQTLQEKIKNNFSSTQMLQKTLDIYLN